ncbi:uncharacterized protein, partial [Malus domestica]|uniref:uncharacterized protein n=1 Tax=Malus domestica TaxID=3750 RepID=UPI003976B73C
NPRPALLRTSEKENGGSSRSSNLSPAPPPPPPPTTTTTTIFFLLPFPQTPCYLHHHHHHCIHASPHPTPYTYLPFPSFLLVSPSLLLPPSHRSPLSTSPKASLQEEAQTQQLEIPEDNNNGEEIEIEIENSDNKEDGQVSSDPTPALKRDGVKPPTLTVKEKKELASYAHSLGKKLKSQLVGKSGLTASVAASFIENLESNELRKVKIHGTCPGELEDVGTQLEESTGSVVTKDIIETHIDGIP